MMDYGTDGMMTNEEYRTVRRLLLPELQSRFYKVGHLHHPLVIGLYLDAARAAWYNETYLQKSDWLEKARAQQDWRTYLYTHERAYRFYAFLDINRGLDDQQYWELLADIWTDSENVWPFRSDWQWLWNSDRPMKRAAMREDERARLDDLPDVITIYRGQPKRNARGMSWSLVRGTAAWFAGRRPAYGDGWLLTATVNKRDVHAFKNDRNEQEIITDKFKVVSRECLGTECLEAVMIARA
jgi:hypothetical protein